MGEWIKTADRMPKSGCHVLFFWRNELGKSRISSGHWIAARTREAAWDDTEFVDYDEAADKYWEPEGWYEWGWELEFTETVTMPVTHWCPMPAAPEDQAQ